PMLFFPIFIVFFAVCVHFISDKTMDKISGAGNIMIKLAPYLVISSFLLFVAYCIHGKDFMLFIPIIGCIIISPPLIFYLLLFNL
ncbi:MAG: hypothetical protein WC925_03745, partial [Bacilli bacterium]